MPRYFIDLRDADALIRDEEGEVFEHIEDALEEAKASARDLIKQFVDDRMPLTATCVEVRDVQGRTIAALTVSEVLAHPVHPHFKQVCDDLPMPRGN
jgi:hypothetical protein